MTLDLHEVAAAGALIFDCDGTLVDTPPLYARAYVQAATAHGVKMTGDWYLARAGLSEHVLMDAMEEMHGRPYDRAALIASMRAAFMADIDALREIEVVADIARAWHGRKPLAVASGGPRRAVETSLGATGLRSLFDVLVTIEDVRAGKPEPDLFLEAARRIGIAPARCLVFEDSEQGVDAARRAGMRVIDVTRLSAP